MLWHHPYGCMIAIWVFGNPLAFTTVVASDGHMIMICSLSNRLPTSKVNWGCQSPLMTAIKMILKPSWCHMMTYFTIAPTYDWNYRSNCGYKSRTICMYDLIFELRYMQSRDSTGPSNWNWEKGKNSTIFDIYLHIG